LVLILSHGNAAVESGFSINKDMLVENLMEDSLIGQRMVYDGIQKAGGVLSVNIDKNMIHSVRAARTRWEETIQKSKTAREHEQSAAAEKRKITSEIKILETKKAKLASEAATAAANIQKEIDQLKSNVKN
jgi:hypothetical protein